MSKYDESEKLLVQELLKSSNDKGKYQFKNINQIKKLTGDASARRYYRAILDDVPLVVCLDNPKKDIENINPFLDIQKFLKSHQVAVPDVYDCAADGSYFLEEDLGDLTLLSRLATIRSYHEENEWYKKVIDVLVKMHSIKNEQMKSEKFYQLSFDEAKFTYEYNFTIEHFILNFLSHDLVAKDKQCLDLHFKEIIREIARQPMVFTHRDYHSRNLMVKQNELVVIDFQDARLGLAQYDLVSVLEDCYYLLDHENKISLVEYYKNKMGVRIEEYKEFERLYDFTLLQRVFKAIGSFAFIYGKKADKRYLKYIHFGMEKIKTTLFKYPELTDLRETLFKIYYAI